MITRSAVSHHVQHGTWRALEGLAVELVSRAEDDSGGVLMRPALGGGTRLMLALEHRLSDDIDLFIRDPQWIGYLTPRLNDFASDRVSGYEEAADFLKLKLKQGEIDFIVRRPLLGLESESSCDCYFELEPVAEVLAKKLFYRGAALTPRDLFDWWAIEHSPQHEVPEGMFSTLLDDRRIAGIQAALSMLERSPRAKTVWSEIRAHQLPPIETATHWATRHVETYRSKPGFSLSPR